jgi:hypothetical protein
MWILDDGFKEEALQRRGPRLGLLMTGAGVGLI